MSELFLVVLALVWAALLVPGALRSRKASPHTTVGGFERAMDVLRSDVRPRVGREVMVPGDASRIVGRAVEAGPVPPRRRPEDPVVARRRFWFTRSLVGTGATFLLALVGGGGWLWVPFLVSLMLTGGYVAVLRHLKLQRDEARRVVADLDLHRDDPSLVIDVADVAVGDTGVGGSGVGGSGVGGSGGGGSGGGSDSALAWSGSGTVRLRRWDD